VKEHYDRLVAKLPRAASSDMSAEPPLVAGGYCDEEHHAEGEAFFKDRAPKTTGGPRTLAEARR
jgi:hypothetical protein